MIRRRFNYNSRSLRTIGIRKSKMRNSYIGSPGNSPSITGVVKFEKSPGISFEEDDDSQEVTNNKENENKIAIKSEKVFFIKNSLNHGSLFPAAR